jgi:hypothetical protein
MKRQRPTEPVWSHETHGPLQATLQQVPFAQCPEAQSASPWHPKPFNCGPQLRAEHCTLAEHCASVVQLDWHRLDFGSQV